MIIPHKDRIFDKDRDRTKLSELIGRHNGGIADARDDPHGHASFWWPEDVAELVEYCGGFDIVETRDVDDTRLDGFIVVARKK